jgi:hypothetical protein
MELRERQLVAEHPALVGLYDDVGNMWLNNKGWEGSGAVMWHETQIDLSGYAKDSLTFFPSAVGLQDPGMYAFKPGALSSYSGLLVLDIVTSVPLGDIDDVMQRLASFNAGPGLLRTPEQFETIIFGQYRFFTPNSNISYPDYQSLERSQRFDSGQPTAADKLYSYRIVAMQTLDLDPQSRIEIPAARHIIAGAMGDESDLTYMMRLKRSYELANQV